MAERHRGVFPRFKTKTRRPSSAMQTRLRLLRRISGRTRENEEPRPDCSHAIPTGETVYCSQEWYVARVGGAAVRCCGSRCGVADLPPERKKDDPEET